jgi:LemA protein
MLLLAVPAAVLALVVLTVVVSYNRFVDERQTIANAWSNVDTELQRRHDLVPNLVETVRGYAAHERATFESVMRARAAAIDHHGAPASANAATAQVELQLVSGIRQLLALSEAYPDLRASAHFLDLQRELTLTENRIQAARRVFNGNVREYNRRIESVPSNLVAKLGRFERAGYFELDEAVRAAGAPHVRI